MKTTTRCCSQCGSNGHNSRTCRSPSASSSSSAVVNGGGGGVMLFGVRLTEDPLRKSVSMNNLSQYEHTKDMPKSSISLSDAVEVAAKVADDVPAGGGGGYASADDAVPLPTAGVRERKRGVPWTEEEHKLFLLGLQKVGKGDWRGISRNFVKTRTPTQVASHAQKYFLRKINLNRRRRRSSLFDITPDNVPGNPLEEPKDHQNDTSKAAIVPITSLPPSETPSENGYAVAPFSVTMGHYFVPMQVQNSAPNVAVGQDNNNYNDTSGFFIQPVSIPVFAVPNTSSIPSASAFNLNERMATEPSPLSWKLSLSSSLPDPSQSSTRYSIYGGASLKNGDGFITVS